MNKANGERDRLQIRISENLSKNAETEACALTRGVDLLCFSISLIIFVPIIR